MTVFLISCAAVTVLLLVTVADYDSAECEVTFRGHDRTLAVGPSNANKCGGELFPWRLKVDAGQRVNVTLIQFAGNHDDVAHDEDASTLTAASYDVIDEEYNVAESTGDDELSTVEMLKYRLLLHRAVLSVSIFVSTAEFRHSK